MTWPPVIKPAAAFIALATTVSGCSIAVWIGFVAPAGTPKDPIEALNCAITVLTQHIAEKFCDLERDPSLDGLV